MRKSIAKRDPSEEDLDVQNAWGRLLYRQWENYFYQYRKGLLEEEEYQAQKEFYRIEIVRDTAQFWEQLKLQHSSAFRSEVDSVAKQIL